MKTKIIQALLICTLTICLAGCSLKNDTSKSDINDASYGSTVIANKEEVISYLTNVIHGECEAETFTFNINDSCSDDVNNYYFFNNSVYIQAGQYMYRFQLSGNEVRSYIRYTVIA